MCGLCLFLSVQITRKVGTNRDRCLWGQQRRGQIFLGTVQCDFRFDLFFSFSFSLVFQLFFSFSFVLVFIIFRFSFSFSFANYFSVLVSFLFCSIFSF